MMLRGAISTVRPPSSSLFAFLEEASDAVALSSNLNVGRASRSKRFINPTTAITCSSSPVSRGGSHASSNIPPKLEPFSRTKLQGALKDPPLIEKTANELAEYCSVLEGEESYTCWRAYFELKELEKESAKEEMERLISQAGGVKSLIGCLHGIAEIHKKKKKKKAKKEAEAAAAEEEEEADEKSSSEKEDMLQQFVHVPDGLPRSQEEIEEEERARMPDSQFTRLLRLRGCHPAWYSPAPDHETD